MNKEKTLEDVIGFLMNVAEFDLRKTKRVPIPGGAMTVTSDNYQYMSEVIDWIEDKIKEPELNENQEIVLEWLKREHFDSYIKSVLSNLYFYVNMTAIGDLENEEIQEMVNAYEELSHEAFAQVLQEFSQWVLEQEEE